MFCFVLFFSHFCEGQSNSGLCYSVGGEDFLKVFLEQSIWHSYLSWVGSAWFRPVNQSKHNSPQILDPSIFPSGHANAKDVVQVKARGLFEIFDCRLFCTFLPGLLTAVTRMRALQKRYFCSNVLCFYFYISFSNWMKAFQISAGICVICPSFLDF